MNNKSPEQLKSSYLIAATITGVVAMTLYFFSFFTTLGELIKVLVFLLVPVFIVFLVKALVFSKAAKNKQPAQDAQLTIVKAQKTIGKIGIIISSIALGLSILVPVFWFFYVGLECGARGATNEGSCAEGWIVVFVALIAIPCGIISLIFLVVSLITFFVNKSKVKNLQQGEHENKQ